MQDHSRSGRFAIGDVINNTYEVVSVLGIGGTSEVYRARNVISGRNFALKVLKSEFGADDGFLALMRREEEIREIRHDAVVRYSENNRTADGCIYLVMDYVEGIGLDRRIRQGAMSEPDVLEMARQLLGGLAMVHAHNIVHRDLSPDNVILRNDDPTWPVIIDFGIAKNNSLGAETIVGNEFAGKYAYAAPEQLEGKADERTDLYALGIVLAAAVRGRPARLDGSLLDMIQSKKAELDLSDLPDTLAALIARLSHPRPEDRFQSADEALAFLDELAPPDPDRTVIAGRPTTVPPRRAGTIPPRRPAASAPVAQAARPRTGLYAGIGAMLAAVAAGGAWVMLKPQQVAPTVTAEAPAVAPAPAESETAALELAAPFTFVAQLIDGHIVLAGHAPDAASKARLEAFGDGDLNLARGQIGAGWGEAVATLLAELGALEEYTFTLEDNRVRVTGRSDDPQIRDRLMALNAPGAMPAPLSGVVEIMLASNLLDPGTLDPVLRTAASCGPLLLHQPPSSGYRPGDTVRVTGALAAPEEFPGLRNSLAQLTGPRPLAIDVEVPGDQVCRVLSLLPLAPSSGLKIRFGDGASGMENPAGIFHPGENPTIDLMLPADLRTGHLWVSIVDVTGLVYQLLPTHKQPDTDLAALPAGTERLRVAWALSERLSDPDRLTLVVDKSIGISVVLVLRSDAPLFAQARPIEESLEEFEAALQARLDAGAVHLLSLDYRRIETRE